MGNVLSLRNQSNTGGFGFNVSNPRFDFIFNSLGSRNNNEKKRKKSSYLNNISFASHFIIAGRRFKNLISQSQTFLFGDQLDLGFILSHKPVLFPYGTPLVEEASKYLQSLVNIRKDTIKLVKVTNHDGSADEVNKYNIEFRFDCDIDVTVKIHYFANEKFSMTNHSESLTLRQLSYICGCSNYMRSVSKSNASSSRPCFCLNDSHADVYTKGANLLFQNQNHTIIPAKFDFKAWQFNIASNYYPIVIECTPVDEQLALRHAHVTLAYIDKSHTLPSMSSGTPTSSVIPENNSNKSINSAGSLSVCNETPVSNVTQCYIIKPIKQKQLIDGVLYSLQEIYGIEKKISPDTGNPQFSQLSVSESNTSSSIATQNSNLSCSKSGTINVIETSSQFGNEEDSVSINGKHQSNTKASYTNNDTMEKKRQLEQEIEQELKGIECVICMCETRDTLILPCRHLCLCKLCAINLRVQSNNCPICRIPFIALLQLKLLKKKDTNLNSKTSELTRQELEQNLPIVRMENLPIVTIENLNSKSTLDVNHENVIIEDNFEIQVEPENKLLCMSKPNIVQKSLLTGMYETVSIYDAFNANRESQKSQISNNNNESSKFSNKSKKFKIKILDPIRSRSDFVVQSVNEIESSLNKAISEKTIPKLFEIQNISNQIELLSQKPKECDLRCSSVVLNKTLNEPPEKIYRSSSFVGNFRQLNKLNESIQMEEVPKNDTEI